MLPKRIRTIAIPAFENRTNNSRLSERITAALAREFISRTRYRIVADPREADAVLTGTVVNLLSYSTLFDPKMIPGPLQNAVERQFGVDCDPGLDEDPEAVGAFPRGHALIVSKAR